MITIVASVIVKRNGKVLFIHEVKDVAMGKFGLPGGKLEEDETLLECAERELYEETGARVTGLELIAMTHKPHTHEGNNVIRFIFYSENLTDPTDESELESTWVDEAEFLQLSTEERVRGKDVVDIVKEVFSGNITSLELPRLYNNK